MYLIDGVKSTLEACAVHQAMINEKKEVKFLRRAVCITDVSGDLTINIPI